MSPPCRYVWTRYRVNYMYLFELDPRVTLKANEVSLLTTL
jgi:hypothetical protein